MWMHDYLDLFFILCSHIFEIVRVCEKAFLRNLMLNSLLLNMFYLCAIFICVFDVTFAGGF